MFDNVGNVGAEPAFKATLRVETAVKNGERLKGITKAFKEKTADMKDILSISSHIEEYDNRECFYLGKKCENSVAAFFEDSFDSMMEKMSDNELVTKLVKIAKSLKAINKRDAHYEMEHDERFRLELEQQRNLRIAESCREKGQELMASRFEVLAGMFGKKLEKLDVEQEKVDVKAFQTIELLADGDKDIIGMKRLIY